MTVIKNLTENKITSVDDFDIDWNSKSLTYWIKDSRIYQHFKRGMFYWSERDRCHVIEIETD